MYNVLVLTVPIFFVLFYKWVEIPNGSNIAPKRQKFVFFFIMFCLFFAACSLPSLTPTYQSFMLEARQLGYAYSYFSFVVGCFLFVALLNWTLSHSFKLFVVLAIMVTALSFCLATIVKLCTIKCYLQLRDGLHLKKILSSLQQR